MSSSSGRTCPGSTTGRTSGRARGSPGAASPGPSGASALRRALGDLAASGASLVRWWLLGDGRAGLSEDGEGRITGLDDRLLADVDAGVLALREAGLRAQFVLTDFLWLDPGRTVNGVRLGGRRDHVRDPSRRARLLEHVFAPIAERYGREPADRELGPDERAGVGHPRRGDARPAALGVAARDARLPGRDGRGLPSPRHPAPERGPRQRPVAVPRRRPRPRPAAGALVREPRLPHDPRATRRGPRPRPPAAPRGVPYAGRLRAAAGDPRDGPRGRLRGRPRVVRAGRRPRHRRAGLPRRPAGLVRPARPSSREA